MTFERRNGDRFEASAGLSRSQYLIAVCSNEAATHPINSVYCEKADIDGVTSLPSILNALQHEKERVVAAEAYAQAQANITAKAQESELLARDALTVRSAELESSTAASAESRRLIHCLEGEYQSFREACQLDQDQQKRSIAAFEEELSHLRAMIVATEARHRDQMLSSSNAYEAEQARLGERLSRQSDVLQETEQALSAARDEHERAMHNMTAGHEASATGLRQARDALACQMASEVKTRDDRLAAADAEASSRLKDLVNAREQLDQSGREINRLIDDLARISGEKLQTEQKNARIMEENKRLRKTSFGYAGTMLIRLFRSA